MTNSIRVLIQPIDDADLPACEMTGTRSDIPVVTWPGEGIHGCVELLLGNVGDPGDYLERLGRRLIAFSHEVRQVGLDAREPTGYDAPVTS